MYTKPVHSVRTLKNENMMKKTLLLVAVVTALTLALAMKYAPRESKKSLPTSAPAAEQVLKPSAEPVVAPSNIKTIGGIEYDFDPAKMNPITAK